ncbi:MAG: hypothetical protein J6386_18395 [Candidatus Synoicihabitans palmerolidicus]|nr:hypothetical protein [Candidatus Synoicihabitans palmerolidicus]
MVSPFRVLVVVSDFEPETIVEERLRQVQVHGVELVPVTLIVALEKVVVEVENRGMVSDLALKGLIR